MISNKFLFSVLAITAANVLGGCYSDYSPFYWDDKVDFKGAFYADDGMTPATGVNLDALDWTFEVYDDTLISRRYDFTTAQKTGVNLNTGPNGLIEFTTVDLKLSADKKSYECVNYCVDKNDANGVCIQWAKDCDWKVYTKWYSILDIDNTSAQVTFRTKFGSSVTVVAQKISHGLTETKNDANHGVRAWLSHDKFILPIAASSFDVQMGALTGVEQGQPEFESAKSPNPTLLDPTLAQIDLSQAYVSAEPISVKTYDQLTDAQKAKFSDAKAKVMKAIEEKLNSSK
jgi:hypothetical protein